MQKKTGKIISFILTLAMVFSMLTGIMPGTGLISKAEKYSGEVDGEVELHIGDIIEPNTEIRLCMDPDTQRYPTVVLKAYGYNDDPELSPYPADEDLDIGMKTSLVCGDYGRLFNVWFPYYDGALADAWIVVSVEDNTITLTGCMEDETLSIVTLNTNGGTINSGNVTTYTEGTEVTLPTDITKENYIFDGWYDNSNLTGWPVEKIADTETGNKEYWAKWKPAVNSWDSGDCTVTFDNGTLSINKKAGDGDGAMADYTHPDLGGSTVAEWIVDYQENITSISVGEGVTHIGDYSLFALDIRDISFPTTLTSIGDKVFYNCFNLESVRISKNVTSIGAGAFEWCISLASVTLVPPKENSTLTIGQNAFNECNNPSVVYANERGMLYDGETAIEAGTAMSDLEGKTLTWEVQTQTPVPYAYYTGTGTSSSENCDEYTIVTAATNNWSTGWYVVNENVDIDSIITVEGTANLILCDGVSLNATKGINLEEGNTLNIYAQSNGSGSITANGSESSAGIGGGDSCFGGTLIIHGGTVNATGGYEGAGIGGGFNGDGGNLTIYNGTVNATGGYEGAGIGGGPAGYGGTVIVYGGTVNAEGGYNSAGIGGGTSRDGGTLTIHGGTVNAIGGGNEVGIGMGFDGDDHGTINLDYGVSLLVSGDNSMWTEYDGTRMKYMKTGATHTHNFSDFTVGTGENANVITATCVADDRETKCPLKDTGYKATLTITAEGGTYNDYDYNATVTNYISPLNGYTLSEIKYYKVDTEGSITGGTLLNHAPCDVGYYYACVTISGGNNSYTAAKAFKITKGTHLFTPTVIMDDYSYEGTVSTPSVYDYYGDGTVTYYYNTTDSTTNGTEWKDITNTTLDAGTYYMYAIISDDSSFEDYTTATTSFEVEKASQTAPAAPTIANFTNNSITLTSVEGCEYKRDNEAWQTSPEFTGLNLNTEYTFYQRKAENINHKTSESSDSTTFTLTNVSDGITVDYENETVTAKNGFDISVDGQNIATSAVSLTEMLDGNTAPIIFVRRAQGENNNAGAWGEVTLDSRPEAPTNLVINAQNGNNGTGAIFYDGSVGLEYRKAETSDVWTSFIGVDMMVAEVKTGVYEVRFSGTNDDTNPQFASESTTVTVGLTYKLWIAGTEITGDTSTQSGEGWSFDPENNVLTLNNFTGNKTCNWGGLKAVIYYSGYDDLTINLIGNNTLDASKEESVAYGYSTNGLGTTIFTGRGTLHAKGTNSDHYYGGSGIDAQGESTIQIENGTIISEGYYGIRNNNNNIIINGGDVTAIGSNKAISGYVINAVPGKGWENASDTDEGTAIDASSVEKSYPDYKKMQFVYPHEHSFTDYALSDDGKTVTANCTANNCPIPEVDGKYTATLTIAAPALTTYGGNESAEASITDDYGLKGDAEVSYYATDTDENKTGDALTAAPTDAGTYWAEVSVETGDDPVAVHVVYTIEKADTETPTIETAGFSVNYSAETFTLNNGYEVSSSASEDGIFTGNSLTAILDSESSEPKIYIRKAATNNTNASGWLEEALEARPDAPTGLTTEKATNSDTADGKINGTTSSMEYSSDNGENWTDASDDATLVKPGTYLVRIKATSTVPAGKAASVEVGNKLKDILANTIEIANNYCENSLGVYDYYNEVKLTLSAAIATATEILNSTTATDDDLEEAIENLSLAYDTAKFYEHQIYVCKRISYYLNEGDSEACKDLVSSAKTEINELEYDSDKTLDDNFATIENIIEKLKSDLDAQRLAEAKDAAKTELAAYRNSFDDSLYDEDGVSELNKAKTDGDTAIDAVTKIGDITDVLKTAKENIDKVYTKDQKAANYVISLIDALPEPVEITWKNIGDYQNDMLFAEQAFNRLTDNQRALINDDRQKKLEGMYIAMTVADTINRIIETIIGERNYKNDALYDEYGIAELDAIKDKYLDEAKSLQWGGTKESAQEIIDTEKEISINVCKELNAVDTISQKNAKAELEAKYDAMKNSGDYDEEGLDELKDAYETAVAAIDAATVSDTKDDPKKKGAWKAEQEGEEALDAVKTKEEKDKEALEISKVLSEISAKTGDDTYYTGKQVELVNKPTTSLPDGYTLEYAVSTSNTEPASGWSTKTPASTEIGSYNVWCRVVEDKKNKVVASKNLTADINAKPSKGTITTDGIYCASNYPSIQAGISIHKSNENDRVEYRWVACDSGKPGEWFEVSPWSKDNNWIDWTPEKSGEYVIVCYARIVGNEEESEIQSSFGTVFHKKIKGICQMPYSGEGGGHLIGIESFDNPDNSYEYEMLILDCNLLIQNKDPWVYTTGRCKTPSNCLWTVWQPQYGYFWTLFRLYDADGNMIDELCYGFANVY